MAKQGNDDLLDDDDLDPNAGVGGAPDDPTGDPKTPDDVEVEIQQPDAQPDEPEAGADGEGEETAEIEAESGQDDDNLDGYSERVRKRIMRERRIKEEREAEASAERQARVRLEGEVHEQNKLILDLTSKNIETQLRDKQAELKKAKDAGDTEAESKVQMEISELQQQRSQVLHAKKQVEAGPPASRQPQANPLTDQWKGRNRWFGDAKYRVETVAAIAIDREVAAEGYKPDTPQFFAELDRRIRKKLPQVAQAARQPSGQPVVKRKQQPPVAAVRGAQPSTVVRGKVTLTRSDIANMHTFKLDPKNPEHVKEYARQKVGIES